MPKKFSEKIREERETAGLSLDELGKRIESTKSYMWELENKDSSRPSAEKLFKLADVFKVSPDYLMDNTGRVPRNPDQAFFSKFQRLSEANKRLLAKFIDSLDDDKKRGT